ncbi:MAG TPA: hybrid sensor histidine kinase/response regulator [Marinospirillum sp.]|uniref:hybrid sensor histidine kinase/response regulator n=1 Tax=Marinospirillum sp. TaxID=2183934 RepID=UPI002B491DAD|nr:hybrid sensor histidine kinase/response regulator [Marinospirillum sp.]HKM15686.1 hybrid sensor histidine kinase/response regulator [Marinospirillum sp.]
MALDIKKFIVRFIEEAKDHLGRLALGLAELEQQYDAENINGLFRSAHTLKGSSRMLKLGPITQIAHSLEDVLSALRDKRLTLTPAVSRLLYQGVDTLTDQVDALAEVGQVAELTSPQSDFCKHLTAVAENPELLKKAPAATTVDNLVVDKSTKKATQSSLNKPSLKASDTVRIKLNKLEELIKLMGELVSNHAGMRELAITARQLEQQVENNQPNLAAMQQFSYNIRETVQAQDRLMQELHDKTLQMRMLPLGIVLDSAARLVREMARSLDKQVECRIQGSEIELDRQMIDQLADPVIHLLRNALDHGIETPAERQKKGKPPQGLVQITARQDAGWVLLDISDDGAGLSLEAIRDKALKKGLVTTAELAEMSQQTIMDLIFLPGFSTSSMITEVSGRGVGMDVVKRAIIDELQGVISLQTKPDQGTCFTLRLPLSLAKMRVLLIRAAGYELGFTAQYIAELVSVPETSLIKVVDRSAVIIRNEFVPVVKLTDLITLPVMLNQAKKSLQSKNKDLILLVICVHTEKLALIIDALLDERDLVIKQLPEHLQGNALISGMVTAGDNALVSLIHVPYLLDKARQLRGLVTSHTTSVDEQVRKHILVVDDSLNTREIERDVLEAWGYQVTLAEHGQEGLDKARAEVFDAVLTDVEMPIMDGFTLTACLREEAAYKNIPIIIITSREKESDRRRGIEVGADAYIVKGSFDQNSLVDTLKILLD